MSDHPEAITSLPEIFSFDKGLLSDAERRLRARLATHCSTALPAPELMKWIGFPEANASDYHNTGLHSMLLLMSCCGLRPEHQVLEPGCGPGRNARHIAPFLDPELGAFEGFDVSGPCIEWAQKAIGKRFPNAQFIHANIKSDFYNPSGDILASKYQFPYEDQRFDVVYLPSVFTHIDQEGFERYVAEIHRVMKPGGRLLSWFFLIDETRLERARSGEIGGFKITRLNDCLWAPTHDKLELYTMYDRQYVLETLAAAGFRSHGLMRGVWAKQQGAGILEEYQDKILSVRV